MMNSAAAAATTAPAAAPTLSPADYRAVLRHDFMSFIERAFYELNPQTPLFLAPYLEVLASKLDAVRQGRCRRLIINVPPRSLKSLIASVALPAWFLGHYPSKHVICASYGQELAEYFARQSRALMLSAWYQALFPTRLSERFAVHDYATTAGGSRMATSVTGALTGRGGDLLIIDDPMKPDEALSESRREAVKQWYTNTLLSRLNDKTTGCIVIVMQRLHQDDLVGHVRDLEDWEVVSFPAIAEAEEDHLIESPLGRRVYTRREGEVLDPRRDPRSTFEAIRHSIGEYNYASQYQQNPLPLGGQMVKTEWLRYYEPAELPERFSLILQSWDTANKTERLNDYSVCTTWGALDKRYYLLDVFRRKLNYPDLKRKVVELARLHAADTILIEDKASGTQLIQELRGEIFGVKAYTPPPGNDKPMRLYAQTAMFENGRVLLPKRAPWLAEYLRELTGFPGCTFKDQVDSTTQALDHLRQSNTLEIWEKLGRDYPGSWPIGPRAW